MEEMKQVLNHLDKVFLGNGAMLLFKYPLMNKKMQELMPAIKAEVEAEGEGGGENTIEVTQRAITRLFEQPIAEDITQLECTDYTD